MIGRKHRWIAVGGLLLLAGALRSQEDPADTFLATIDVRVINIETVVTDGKGNRVPGLGPEDFRLLVDGQEVQIGYFSEIREGRTIAPEPLETSSVVAAVQPLAISSEPDVIPTNYLVFVEDVFPRGAHRNIVLKKLRKQIDELGPADQMAVMAFDGLRLEPLADWTRSPEELHAALSAAAKRPAAGEFRTQEQRAFSSGVEVAATFFSQLPFSQATGYASLLQAQLRSVIGAASTAIRVAGRPEGRRVMLLLSGGWPFEVLSPMNIADFNDPTFGPGTGWDANLFRSIQSMNSLDYFLLFPRGLDLYEMLIDTANRMSYTLYPVDVPGLQWTGADVTTEEPSMTQAARLAGIDRQSQDEGTLILLAEETGGKALLNDLRLDALDTVAKDTRSYYWLGFQAQVNQDDERHSIEVEPRRKGLKIRSRKSYVDLSRSTEAAMATEAALYMRRSDNLGLIVTVGEPQQVVRDQIEVPLRLSIPVEEITILPIDRGYAAHLELNIQARDGRANVSDLQRAPIRLRSATEPEPGSRTFFETWITLRDQRNDLAVTVRDLASENKLTTYISVGR